jgi:hypothetical protein
MAIIPGMPGDWDESKHPRGDDGKFGGGGGGGGGKPERIPITTRRQRKAMEERRARATSSAKDVAEKAKTKARPPKDEKSETATTKSTEDPEFGPIRTGNTSGAPKGSWPGVFSGSELTVIANDRDYKFKMPSSTRGVEDVRVKVDGDHVEIEGSRMRLKQRSLSDAPMVKAKDEKEPSAPKPRSNSIENNTDIMSGEWSGVLSGNELIVSAPDKDYTVRMPNGVRGVHDVKVRVTRKTIEVI